MKNTATMHAHKVLSVWMILILAAAAVAQSGAAKISEAELKKVITENADCADEHKDQVDISHLEYYDFNGDGVDEAVVVAYTCNGGTGGPDVHAVYTRDAAGKIVEIPIPDLDQPRGPQMPLFGNANYTLKVDRGQLVAYFGDTSDREDPVEVWFKWNDKGFELDHKKIKGPFQTSYDCAKATKEMDLAICYAPTVAPLDLEMGKLYRARMQQLSPEKKQALQTEQRAWLAGREKQCVIYKWWVDCLKEMYIQRIAELKR